MPLLSGKKNIGRNIQELSRSEKQKKRIGNINTSGLSKKKVNQIEIAVAFNKAKRSNKK